MTVTTTTKGTDGNDDEVEEEKINLTRYNDKQKLHELFQQKGLVLKNEDAIRRMKEERRQQTAKEEEKNDAMMKFKREIKELKNEIADLKQDISDKEDRTDGDGVDLDALIETLETKREQLKKMTREYSAMGKRLRDEL